MRHDEPSGPDLAGDVATPTPDLRVNTRYGVVEHSSWQAAARLVGFKRLAGRPQDRLDLAELEAIHGDLPIEPILSLDDC